MNDFWQQLPRPFFGLAPMEDVTDHVFRRVVAKASQPDVYFSEFTNATGWVHAGNKAIGGRLNIHREEKCPLIAQIWGGIPEDIAKLAAHCKKLGYQAIDINMGCPVKHAIKVGGGSALIRDPELASEIIAAAKTAGLPVSVKTRLGYSSIEEWTEWLRYLLEQDIAALTIHLRTRKEMSKVPAHWELIPAIKQLRDDVAPNTLLIGNGDIADRIHGQQLINQTGIDGIMIGRGIFSNIFAFENRATEHTPQEFLSLLNYHLDLFEAGSSRPYETLKRFYKIYVRDFPGSHELRTQLMETADLKEAQKILSTTSTVPA